MVELSWVDFRIYVVTCHNILQNVHILNLYSDYEYIESVITGSRVLFVIKEDYFVYS